MSAKTILMNDLAQIKQVDSWGEPYQNGASFSEDELAQTSPYIHSLEAPPTTPK